MTLSPTSYEILSDLLALRLESFLVTTREEATEMRQLRICQRELEHLSEIGTQMIAEPVETAAETETVPETLQKSSPIKLSRRLQRLLQSLEDNDAWQARAG